MAKSTKPQVPGTALAKPLARPGDPYVDSRGNVYQAEVAGHEKEAKASGELSPKTFKPSKKRTMNEMPAPVTVINGVACVFMYTLMGVGDREIADGLGITAAELKHIRNHTAYDECFNAIANEFINVNSDLIQARIAAYGHEALTSVANIAMHGKKDGDKLKASADLLDRGGFGPRENLLRGSMGKNDLRIVVVDGDKQVNVTIGTGE